jgi:DNA-directed RNA polymerase specialized sigma24 family protein
MNDEILKLYENKFMFKQAMRLAKDVDRAHDLVQDTMIRLMDNANKYTASSKITPRMMPQTMYIVGS